MAYLMTIADKDTMTLKDALNEPDAEEFLKAMVKEVDDASGIRYTLRMANQDQLTK